MINIRDHSQTEQLLGMDAEETSRQPQPRAAMVILARNQDLDGVLLSMRRLEARFNNSQYRCSSVDGPPCPFFPANPLGTGVEQAARPTKYLARLRVQLPKQSNAVLVACCRRGLNMSVAVRLFAGTRTCS